MFVVDVGKRFTIEQCLAHPWLASEDDKAGSQTVTERIRPNLTAKDDDYAVQKPTVDSDTADEGISTDAEVPEAIRDDMQLDEPSAHVTCWTFTPGDTKCEYKMPLQVDGHPVVIPVHHPYPLMAIASPPPDPHPRFISSIDPLPDGTISEIFGTFKEAIGFYLLINGYLQVIVPDEFDHETSHSRLPTEFGGLKIRFIHESFFPTSQIPGTASMSYSPTALTNPRPDLDESGAATTAPLSTASRIVAKPSTRTPNLQTQSTYLGHTASFKRAFGSTVRVVVENNKSKDLFEGKIGVLIRPVEETRRIFATVPTHVFTSAYNNNSKKAGSTQMADLISSVSVLSTSSSINLGNLAQVFDPCPQSFPIGFTSDVSLVDITMATARYIPETINTVSPAIEWLDQPGWMNIKYNSNNLVLLDSEPREAKSIGIVDSRCQMVGQGIFRTQQQAKRRSFFGMRSSRSTNPQDELRTWTNLVARSILYRVRQDVHIRGGQSGTPVCLMEDGGNANAAPVAKVAGFASFVQMASDVQRYDMEGDKLYKRLQEGRVAFYGAFQVPDELRDGYRIV
ncbi:hypothetical protein EDB81DRAFT_49846 [Dactylonectria macrodidyma]|uniref:Protein kinase domain-containing protein n=1 Tax=Dactylonectria macrodidyma TaxID=307937 RepID=A0A9P9JRZ7_9HYPO|nr:hypothetical protein EDB81DRAFT_49846 [Dactylonectria macrodidyma]